MFTNFENVHHRKKGENKMFTMFTKIFMVVNVLVNT